MPGITTDWPFPADWLLATCHLDQETRSKFELRLASVYVNYIITQANEEGRLDIKIREN